MGNQNVQNLREAATKYIENTAIKDIANSIYRMACKIASVGGREMVYPYDVPFGSIDILREQYNIGVKVTDGEVTIYW